MFGWFRKRRRNRILAQSWPKAWSQHLERNIPATQYLDDSQLRLLQDRTQIFVAEKHWEGLEGLEITEEMQVTIAAQASFMLLGVKDFYFDNVKTILIFPNSFRRQASDGISVKSMHLSGEAWQGGPIVLSWQDVLYGCRHPQNGSNVVIHEFAHALDGLDGYMGGNISFERSEDHKAWEQVVQQGFDELVEAAKYGEWTLLDHYGATSKAEYFAVATETFFEIPRELQFHHPDLYDLLLKYFKVDPTTWS